MSATPEPAWKRWLDRLLMVNVLLGGGVAAVSTESMNGLPRKVTGRCSCLPRSSAVR